MTYDFSSTLIIFFLFSYCLFLLIGLKNYFETLNTLNPALKLWVTLTGRVSFADFNWEMRMKG